MRRVVIALAVLAVVGAVAIRILLGGGERLEDRTGPPSILPSEIETVADLDLPPGNVAVSPTGRVFFTLHPEASPATQLHELVDGKPVAWPDGNWQQPRPDGLHFQSLLSIRIDRQGRLWALDFADYAWGTPRILAFDLETGELVHHRDFTPEEAPFGSMLNDFQVDSEGRYVYIADTSLFRPDRPALIVYDSGTGSARRLLEGHESVVAKRYVMRAAGERTMTFLFGLVSLRIGVDSIALSRDDEWLYYAPVSDDRMYRIRTDALRDQSLAPEDLAGRVEDYGPKTLTDGLSTDVEGNLYLTDMEHSAILTLGEQHALRTLVKDERLRWPDGLSFGPGGWLYVTCSALHEVILESGQNVRENAPYQIYRFRPGPYGVPGH